jgi:hypothetical protein
MTWTAQVVGHEIARDEKDNSPFGVYVVEARLNDETYVVKRRFQAFVELKKQVRSRCCCDFRALTPGWSCHWSRGNISCV